MAVGGYCNPFSVSTLKFDPVKSSEIVPLVPTISITAPIAKGTLSGRHQISSITTIVPFSKVNRAHPKSSYFIVDRVLRVLA